MTKNMIINGKKVSEEIKNELKEEVSQMDTKPCLAVILVGNDSGSQIYVRNKKKACEFVGIKSISHELKDDLSEETLLKLIDGLNKDEKIHGILLQLPLPAHINVQKVIMKIDPKKDVDCFHPVNVGKLYTGNPDFLPCTPAGIIELLKRYRIDLESKDAVVIGRSNIVGKPIVQLLLDENATVTICHSRTANLNDKIRKADIVVAAIGKTHFVMADMVKPGATVIDVGINRLDSGKLAGDVDFDKVKDVAGAITPVPGGVGPMTIAMLMRNCVKAVK